MSGSFFKQVSGVWTALKGNVFNITPYLDYHPGGVDELMKGAGRDCTALFDKVRFLCSILFVLFFSLLRRNMRG